MKIILSDNKEFIPSWRGNDKLPKKEQFKMLITPLTQGDLLDIMDARTGEGSRFRELIAVAKNILGKYVTIENLFHGEAPVTVDDLFVHPVYLSLIPETIDALTELAIPTEEEAKN